ncbi:beta-phosphoglucomutase family hydrolase [Frankia sp. AgB32]|uniref:beta-phosphoglucomutase family hydrolase n=1 Tax=Frankia sp. AgB32 TaxID=631119 RepID=UPI00200F66A3|nr:beta-phosphoglucomutase family hydrolase [Frankia sp. AgB32]MCK9897653.1 beta-phosphoglucomutase family hydrolase [Frankia sp. AgB32]
MLGLPDHVEACLFDLDGVLTNTATVHAAAWKEMFDDFLENWASRSGEPFVPFDLDRDYAEYVDGLPRADGVRAFLDSRHIRIPVGTPDDPPSALTVNALGTRKNLLVQKRIAEDGVEVYQGSVTYLHELVDRNLPRAVVSSSANAAEVLRVTGLDKLIDTVVDGQTAAREKLAGKPAPDTFLAGARLLGVPAARAAVFEDALAGVQAGQAGEFGFVVGVNRLGSEHADGLRAHGADTVVQDLAELLASSGPGRGQA